MTVFNVLISGKKNKSNQVRKQHAGFVREKKVKLKTGQLGRLTHPVKIQPMIIGGIPCFRQIFCRPGYE